MAQFVASRHAVWLGAAAIITDQIGRVLLVRPTYRKDDTWLLPGGVVEPGEHPHVTCRREITEVLGLADLPLARVLAVHSLSQHHHDLQLGPTCPGEVRFVFDGGSLTPDQVEAIRLPREELSEYAFLETRDAVQRLRPVDGRIMLAAYRARLGDTAAAHLADGRHVLGIPALDRLDVHVRYRPMWDSPLNRGPVPGHLPVQQAWAWCFIPDVMQAESVSMRLVSQVGHVTRSASGPLPQRAVQDQRPAEVDAPVWTSRSSACQGALTRVGRAPAAIRRAYTGRSSSGTGQRYWWPVMWHQAGKSGGTAGSVAPSRPAIGLPRPSWYVSRTPARRGWAMMFGQARSRSVLMGLDNRMITNTVPAVNGEGAVFVDVVAVGDAEAIVAGADESAAGVQHAADQRSRRGSSWWTVPCIAACARRPRR